MNPQPKTMMVVEEIEEPVLDDLVVEIAAEAPVQHKRRDSTSAAEACVIFLASFVLMGITWGVIASLKPTSAEASEIQQVLESIHRVDRDLNAYKLKQYASLANTAVVPSNVVKDKPVFYASEEFQQEFEALLDKHQAKLQDTVPLSGGNDAADARQ